MTDNLDPVVRNSLDAIDRGRRWATFGVIALFVATAIAVAALFGAAATRQSSAQGTAILKALFVATATQMLFVACCTWSSCSTSQGLPRLSFERSTFTERA